MRNLKLILGGYEKWFKEVHDKRNDYIIHSGKMTFTGVGFSENVDYINTVLSTTQGDKHIAISNEILNADVLMLKTLFKDVSDYLISIISDYPLSQICE